MRGARWPGTLAALAALVAGCSGDDARPRTETRQSASPTEVPAHMAERPITRAKLDKLAAFLDKAKSVEGGEVSAKSELWGVEYTSPTDAAAEIYDCRKGSCSTVIATTDDNWAHAAGLAINQDLADLVSYLPLGRGAVAIKAKDQTARHSYPPFVLYPDGEVTPLRVQDEPRAVDAGNELLPDNFAFGDTIGLDGWILGADVDAGELFGLPPLPPRVNGLTYEDVPGREGLVNVSGYHRDGGDEVWRFSESTDDARTWRTTDVPLRWGDRGNGGRCWPACGIYRDTDDYQVAVGPGHFQALALTDVPEDSPFGPALPDYLRQLWLTDDEKAFRRVPQPWDPMAFAGMAFASDGALLVSEAKDPLAFCADTCRAGRIWRLPPGGDHLKPMADAPTLSAIGRDDLFLQNAGGGMIVARTGNRTIVVSPDGYSWTEVTPGG